MIRADRRIRMGISILACPDNLAVIDVLGQSAHRKLVDSPAAIPDSMVSFLRTHDTVSSPYRSLGPENPFLGKSLLVIQAEDDRVAPWALAKEFVEGLELAGGRKKVVHFPGKHLYTEEMMVEVIKFFWEEVLVQKTGPKPKL